MELLMAIYDYVGHHNEHPKPFIWTAPPPYSQKHDARPQDAL
jgi:hypothetical protein